jgi:hypothetical protein
VSSERQTFLLTLDHEVFFGNPVGTVDRCMIEPVTYLLDRVEPLGVKLTLFVDAGFLIATKGEGRADRAHSRVARQLTELIALGHDVQLHIHPHWEDSRYHSGTPEMVTRRYRLHDFTPLDRNRIVALYQDALEDVVDMPVFAYRAGGWCAQPFSEIGDALRSRGIWLDSSVYYKGRSVDEGREFDFAAAPNEDLWRFQEDPLVPTGSGDFVELPISSVRLGPPFYVATKVRLAMADSNGLPHGDGKPLAHSAGFAFDKLSRWTWSPATLDGGKARLLPRAHRAITNRGGKLMNVTGHPKSMSRDAVELLCQFLEHRDFAFHTVRSLVAEGEWHQLGPSSPGLGQP